MYIHTIFFAIFCLITILPQAKHAACQSLIRLYTKLDINVEQTFIFYFTKAILSNQAHVCQSKAIEGDFFIKKKAKKQNR